MSFKDHFSATANDYARFRPHYPQALFRWLAAQCPANAIAWDCATGNGQAACALAECLPVVHASDASEAQIAAAQPHPRVHYRVAPAEASGLADGSVDLVTVAQAAHWFDHAAFHRELERVLKPDGLLVIWCYGKNRIDARLDEPLDWFYHQRIGRYWPPERDSIDRQYADLPFPYPRLSTPDFAMRAHWDLESFLGYLGTWSAVSACRREEGKDPLPELRERLLPLWGAPEALREIQWPLTLLAGRKPGT